jgi:hypothetical protein
MWALRKVAVNFTKREYAESVRKSELRSGHRAGQTKANSHMPFHAPVMLRCVNSHTPRRVLCESPRVIQKYLNCQSHSLTDGMLLITFVELCVVAGRSRTQARHPHAVSGRPELIHTCHAHVALWHGMGTAGVNQTQPQMGKTQSKPLAARHGICELALTVQ